MAGTLKHRHVSVTPDSGAEISSPEWNDSMVAAEGTDGQIATRDAASPDGWKWSSVAAGSSKAAFASRPAAGSQSIFFPTDAPFIQRDNGVTYDSYGPLFPLTVPVDPGTWVNQGSSAIALAKDSLLFTGSATGSGSNIVARVRTAPATPWTLTICCLVTMFHKANQGYGLCFRQSSDGKMHTLTIDASDLGLTTLNLSSFKWTSATVFSATYTQLKVPQMVQWLRIADNGSNRITSWSADGQNFTQLDSNGRTDFLTADQCGLVLSTENSAVPNFAPIMNVISLSYT